MPLVRLRSLFLLAFVASLAILGGTFYLELGLGLVPCPLCLSQRILLSLFAIVCLGALLQRPRLRGLCRYAAVALVCAVLGVLLAARHIWLQSASFVPEMECHPPLGYLVYTRSWSQVLEAMLLGSPDCVRISWTFMDLSVPEWSLLAFMVLALFTLTVTFVGLRIRMVRKRMARL